MTVGSLIIAAGNSTRMGFPKQLLLGPDGRTLLEMAVGVALETGLSPVVVVLGANFDQIQLVIKHLPVIILRHDKWSEGMGSSIARGVSWFRKNALTTESLMVLLCDQPFVSAGLLHEIMQKQLECSAEVVVSEYSETIGPPALFARAIWPELSVLQGDKGAKSVLMRHAKSLVRVPFPQGAMDLDSPGDVARWRG